MHTNKQISKWLREYFKRELDVLHKIDKMFWQKGYPKMEKELERKLFNIYDEAYEQGHATGVVIGDKLDKALKK